MLVKKRKEKEKKGSLQVKPGVHPDMPVPEAM